MRPLRILITAGPTREMLDPVRFISNVSTGEMGYAVARAARNRGWKATLVSGPTALNAPRGVKFVPVVSAAEMKKACGRLFKSHDILIMSAAVCDFTASSLSKQKIRRTKTKSLLLKQTSDIVAGIAAKKGRKVVIGFCLETENWLKRAEAKLKRKSLDGIVANFYTSKHIPFGRRKITTAFLQNGGGKKMLRNQAKPAVARQLLSWGQRLFRIKN